MRGCWILDALRNAGYRTFMKNIIYAFKCFLQERQVKNVPMNKIYEPAVKQMLYVLYLSGG